MLRRIYKSEIWREREREMEKVRGEGKRKEWLKLCLQQSLPSFLCLYKGVSRASSEERSVHLWIIAGRGAKTHKRWEEEEKGGVCAIFFFSAALFFFFVVFFSVFFSPSYAGPVSALAVGIYAILLLFRAEITPDSHCSLPRVPPLERHLFRLILQELVTFSSNKANRKKRNTARTTKYLL